jgi:hypothetical protein
VFGRGRRRGKKTIEVIGIQLPSFLQLRQVVQTLHRLGRFTMLSQSGELSQNQYPQGYDHRHQIDPRGTFLSALVHVDTCFISRWNEIALLMTILCP